MKKLIYLILIIAFAACQSGNKKVENSTEVKVVEATIDIGGMHCENCVKSIEKGINGVEGIAEAIVSLNDSNAAVKFDATKTDLVSIEKAIEKRGFSIKKP